VARVLANASAAGWDNVVDPIDDATERLARAWGVVAHLNAVVDTAPLRAEYNRALPRLTAFWTELAQNPGLFERYRDLAQRSDFAAWPPARRRVVGNELRDFRLGGAELDAEAKQRLAQVRARQAQLTSRFSENVLDASDGFELILAPGDTARLAGIPDDVRAMYREAAAAAGKEGYRISLHMPSYLPALQYADDRALRRELYHAYSTRASEFGPPERDNGPLMVELLALRAEQAQLLGFDDFVALSLVPKMAQSRSDVLKFLRELAQRARPFALREVDELRQFGRERLGYDDLQAWDIPYASEKLRQASYDYSEQELKQYFPVERVLAGLFRVIETLFDVAITPIAASSWHPDVRCVRIASRSGNVRIGECYLDLFARDHKRGGAWQGDARTRRRTLRGLQTPISLVVCNFSPPVGGRDALLAHRDVVTLFHEFGHALHHLLTQVDELQVAGIRGVEWDAVELPSQFMENFAWEWEVLQLLSGHVDHGAPLPRALFGRMLAARHFQAGLLTQRQVEFALFDILVHSIPPERRRDPADLVALAEQVRAEVAVLLPPAYHRGTHTFSHIFAGGYSAGYYSYKWAEVLSADCYAAFEEGGQVLDRERGARFRSEILGVGGSRPALESFVAFRGRPPRIDALLKHSGMAA
jgi:oligopeptidase A